MSASPSTEPTVRTVSRNLKRYRVSDQRIVNNDGRVESEPGLIDGEIVDEEFVLNYTSIEARRFFINLGGIEAISKTKGGIITCKSTNPDRTEVRVVKFTPVQDAEVE